MEQTPTSEQVNLIALVIGQFKNILVIVLILAAVISLFLGDVKDVIVIFAIVVADAGLGTYQEYQAEQALEALSSMQVPQVRVRRGGEVKQISAEDLVPGDIVLLGEGDRVPADGRLVIVRPTGRRSRADWRIAGSVQNVAAIDAEHVGLGDRHNFVYMGAAVTYGRGEMLVTGTGLQTELGKIASMLMGVEESERRCKSGSTTWVCCSCGARSPS